MNNKTDNKADNKKEPIVVNTKATTRLLKAIIRHQPLTISAEDTIKYLGLTSRNGFIQLTKRLERIGLIDISRNKPLPNTYTITKDKKVLEKYHYLIKGKVELSLED